MTGTAVATTNGTTDAARELALLKAIGLDRAQPEQRELALAIAKRYDLDPMLKHLVLIDGKPFITRDGLLWVAHRSGVFDGIAVTEPAVVDGFWRCLATVWRKDMSHPIEYPGRYPTSGGNQKFAPEMAIKVAESMALRRAFNVAAPAVEERWDVDLPPEPVAPPPTLAERAAQARAAIDTSVQEASDEPPVAAEVTDESSQAEAAAVSSAEPEPQSPPAPLSKQAFVDKIDAAGIDQRHANVVRMVMFPDDKAALDDAQRRALWEALEAEATAAR